MIWLAAFLALLIGAAFAVSEWRAARVLAAYPPEGQMIEVDGRVIHAEVMGEGPDVVLIHGSSGSTRDMTFRLAGALSDRYRVIVMDRPGLGHSDPIPGGGSINEQAEALQLAASALGADRPIVLGQSYGGAVALAWAVARPDTLAAVVPLSAPSQPWTTDLEPLYRVNSSWYAPVTTIPLIAAFVPTAYVQSQVEAVFAPQEMPAGYADHIGAELALTRSALRATAFQRANLLAEITALQPRWAEITVPMEIVHGDADTTVGHQIHSEPLARQVGSARLTLLPGIGHVPQNVATEQVSAAIDRAAARAGLQ